MIFNIIIIFLFDFFLLMMLYIIYINKLMIFGRGILEINLILQPINYYD